jgi:adenine-specific DNA-methyltransferase
MIKTEKEMIKLDGKTQDLISKNITKLRELFPEAFTEGKIDFEALRLALGDEVETEDERYSFTWHGKTDAIKLALKQSTGTLKPCKEESKDWDTTKNIFIEGDNLEVLRILQASYRNKIKMIYIDPPYNTGNDFIYEDDFKDPIKNYKEKIGEVGKANPETAGRYHTNWLNMMYPRLRLARNLLKEDGVIFISIDDNEVHNLRKICDEIFGEENFVSHLTNIVKTEGRRYGFFAKTHEYILCYAKDNERLLLNELLVENKKFQFEDELGGFDLKELRNQNTKAFNSTNRPNLRYPFYVNQDSCDQYGLMNVSVNKTNNSVEVLPIVVDGLESVWRWGKDTSRLNEKTQLISRKGTDGVFRIFQKYRSTTQAAKTVWFDKGIISNKGTKEVQALFGGKTVFDFPKPVALLKRLFEIGTSEGDLCLDFFSGCASSAHAVMALNAEDGGKRRCISVQIPEKVDEKSEAYKAGYRTIADISKERIRRAGEKIKAEKQSNQGDLFNQDSNNELDIGFKVFKLDETNFTQWDDKMTDAESALLKSVQALKPNSTQEDALYEILLKYGVDLSLAIQELTIKGKKVYSLADNYLLICLEKELDLETIEEIAQLNPERVVFYDNGFKDDVVKLNAGETLKKFGVKDIRVI